jgi:hypothetical protein
LWHTADDFHFTYFTKDTIMRYNLLGRTGLYDSELSLGTMTFGG